MRLTLKRLLLQISALDERSLPGEAAVAHVLGNRRGGESHVVLVVEQADSLDPDAMRFLRALAESFKGRVPSLHVLLAGSLALLDLVSDQPVPPDAADLADLLPELEPSSLAIPAAPVSGPPAAAPPGQPRRLGVLVAAGLALCLVAGAALTVRSSVAVRSPAPAVKMVQEDPRQATPAQAAATTQPDQQPTPPASQIGAATPSGDAAPPEPSATPAAGTNGQAKPGPMPAMRGQDITRLRTEFRRFLSREGRSRTAMTSAQRDALFNDYLDWRARQTNEAAH